MNKEGVSLMLNRLRTYWMILTGKHHYTRYCKMSLIRRIKFAYDLFKIFKFRKGNLEELTIFPETEEQEKLYFTSMIGSPWRKNDR